MRIDGRGADLGAEAAEVGEAEVVEQDHDDVGRARGRAAARRPVRASSRAACGRCGPASRRPGRRCEAVLSRGACPES